MPKFIDLTGKRFGKLIAIEHWRETTSGGYPKIMWRCKCDCGNETIVGGNDLRKGHTKSCGCLQKEEMSKISTTHGKSKTPLYKVWCGMRTRCSNPNQESFQHYGAKGIRVCDEWQNYEAFEKWAMDNGWHKGLTIERIDINGNYCPGNCKLITPKEQYFNRTDSRFITYKGKTQTIREWADEVGLIYSCLLWRIDSGWDIERAMTTPSRKHAS